MNKQEQGRIYRARVLMALSHLGYATTRQLAKIVWWKCDGSTRKMAGRTLRWLLARGLIVSRRNHDCVNGEMLVAVTRAGARWLAENGVPLPPKEKEEVRAHARDWLRHAHSHRTACNSVYAATVGLFPDRCAWSELEVRSGRSPLGKLAYGYQGETLFKIPDVVLERTNGLTWVEVENTWRSEKDLFKAVASIRKMIQDERIAQIYFVVTAPGAKTIGRRLRKALTHGPLSEFVHEIKVLDARILQSNYIKVFELDNESMELIPVTF